VPTLFVGVHLALVGLVALFGLVFLANPCGGDLCLGGIAALFAFGVAGLGVLGLGIWRIRRRASPLLAWDSAMLAGAGGLLASTYPYGPDTTRVGVELVLFAALPAAVLAGMAVAPHRMERLGAIAAFIAIGVLGGEGGLAVLGCGLLALAAGWLFIRMSVTTGRRPGEISPISRPGSP
jgi:hypothetical protein